MGLDVGERRIGLAYANFLEMGSSIVVPGGFLLVNNKEGALTDLADLAEEEGVAAVVAGLPLRNGEETSQSKKIKAFLAELQPRLPEGVQIFVWDEALTSFASSHLLRDAELKHSGQKAKGRVDAVAATLILQSFVDAHRGHLPPVGPVL